MRGLLLAALAIGIWVPLVPRGARQPEKRVIQTNRTTNTDRATKPAQNQQSTESEAIKAILAQGVQIQQQNAQILQAAESQTNQEIAIEGKLVKYTRALVYVGVLQALVLLLTVGAIYRQITATKNAERAWIIVSPAIEAPPIGYGFDPANPMQQEDFGKDNPNIFLARFKNTGNTPARLVDSMLAYRQVSRLEDIPKEPDYGQRSPFNDLLVAKEDSIGAFAPLQPNPIVTKGEALALRRGEIFWYAYGIVTYLDGFGRMHETRFGYLYFFPLGGDPRQAGLVREGLPLAYNGAT
jgi:hypothetical protein